MASRRFKLLTLFIRVSIQNLTAYRFDLLVRSVMSVIHVAAELVAVWTIFNNAKTIRGWSMMHMLVLIGVFRMVAGGIRMSIVPNMRKLLEDIREGTLDFVLLKPVNAQYLVSIREFVIWRATDVLLGLAIALYGVIQLTGTIPFWGAVRFLVVMLAAGAILYSLWLALATLCFWFVRIDNIEMVFWNVFEAGRYPIVVYPQWVQSLLTFIIPLAFITTIPASTLIGDENTQVLGPAAPLFALAFAVVSLLASGWFWRFGLRHYSGASA
jgi:ABC-2 type transport system permease protein